MGRYTTVDQVRRLLRTGSTGTWQQGGQWDDQLETLIATAEAGIDNLIGVSPVNAATSPTDRRYDTPLVGRYLEVCWYTGTPATVHRVLSDGTVSDTALTGWAVEGVETADRGRRFLRRHLGWTRSAQVEVTARWGHPAVPQAVRTAAAQWAVRMWHEQSAPLGIADVGGMPMRVGTADPMIVRLIRHWMPPAAVIV